MLILTTGISMHLCRGISLWRDFRVSGGGFLPRHSQPRCSPFPQDRRWSIHMPPCKGFWLHNDTSLTGILGKSSEINAPRRRMFLSNCGGPWLYIKVYDRPRCHPRQFGAQEKAIPLSLGRKAKLYSYLRQLQFRARTWQTSPPHCNRSMSIGSSRELRSDFCQHSSREPTCQLGAQE